MRRTRSEDGDPENFNRACDPRWRRVRDQETQRALHLAIWSCFFSEQAFYRTAIAVGFVEAGNLLGGSSAQHHGDLFGGLILIAVGISVAVVLVHTNVKSTSLAYDPGGSVVLIAIFSALAWISIPILFIVLIGQSAVISIAQPIYFVDRQTQCIGPTVPQRRG